MEPSTNRLPQLWQDASSRKPSSGQVELLRISGDDLRKMFFNEPIPSSDEELPYSMLTIIRDELLRRQYNIIIDTMAPTNLTRSYLMRTKVPNADSLLIVVVASRDLLLERIRARGNFGAIEAWDR